MEAWLSPNASRPHATEERLTPERNARQGSLPTALAYAGALPGPVALRPKNPRPSTTVGPAFLAPRRSNLPGSF